jgi:hypothetical protein
MFGGNRPDRPVRPGPSRPSRSLNRLPPSAWGRSGIPPRTGVSDPGWTSCPTRPADGVELEVSSETLRTLGFVRAPGRRGLTAQTTAFSLSHRSSLGGFRRSSNLSRQSSGVDVSGICRIEFSKNGSRPSTSSRREGLGWLADRGPRRTGLSQYYYERGVVGVRKKRSFFDGETEEIGTLISSRLLIDRPSRRRAANHRSNALNRSRNVREIHAVEEAFPRGLVLRHR